MTQNGALQTLFDAYLRQATGIWEVQSAFGRWWIGLRAGQVVQVEGRRDLLKRFNLSGLTGDLTRDLGQAVARGVSPDQVFAAAEEGLGSALLALVADPDGAIRPAPDRQLPQGAFPLPTSLPRIVARAFDAPERSITDVEALREHRVSAARSEEIRGMDPVEQRILQLAQKSVRVGELIATVSRGDAGRTRRAWTALEMLLAAGLLAMEAPTRTTQTTLRNRRDEENARRVDALREKVAREKAQMQRISAAETAPKPPKEPSELERLQAAHAALQGKDPLEILELAQAPQLTSASLMSAFREVGGRYHPDRFAAASPEVKALANQIFALVTSAADQLKEPEALERANKVLDARARGELYVDEMSAAKARVYFRKAEAASRQRNRAVARELAEKAVELDPRQIEHKAFLIFCQVADGILSADQGLTQAGALKPEKMADRVAIDLLSGRLLKIAGRGEEAVQRFRKVLEILPEHQDAKREVWLHERRQTEAQPEPTGASKLSSLFGKRE